MRMVINFGGWPSVPGLPGSTTANFAPRLSLTYSLSRSVDWLGDDDDDDGWRTTVSRTQPLPSQLPSQRLVCPKTHPPRGRNPRQNRPPDECKDCPGGEKWLLRLEGPLETACGGLGRGREGALNTELLSEFSADPLARVLRRRHRYISRM